MIPMPAAGTAELMRAAATFNTKVAAGGQQAGQGQGRAGPDRDHAQGRDLQDRQGHPLPLSAAGRAEGRDAGADRLQPDRPLHDDRPAGGPVADPQPAQAGGRRLGGRLGQFQPCRPLPDHRRLCAGLSRRLRRRDAPRDRGRGGQPARHLRGRGVHPCLRRAGADAGEEPHPDGDAARFPCRPGRGEARARLPQCLDAQPDRPRTSTG